VARLKPSRYRLKKLSAGREHEIGDYNIKLNKLIQFLTDGDRTKITLRYRGREMAHQELGVKLLKRVEKDLEDYGTVEQFPKMEGRQLVMVMTPKKN